MPFLFEVSYFVRILRPFAEQADSIVFEVSYVVCISKFKRIAFSRIPVLCASWGLSQSKPNQAPFLFDVSYCVCILGPFAEQANSNASPSSRFPILCVSWGISQSKQMQTPSPSRFTVFCLGPFAEQSASNAFPFRGFLSCVHLGAFPCFVCILGPFAKQTNSSAFPLRTFLFCMHLEAQRKQIERLSSSRFPILCASWGLSQSKQILTPFLLELSYFVCILGFEVCVCILGPFAKQANSIFFTLQGFLSCVHLGAFRKSKQIQTTFFSRFPVLCASWGLSQSKQMQTPFLFEVSYFVCISGPFAKQASSNAFPLRATKTPPNHATLCFVCVAALKDSRLGSISQSLCRSPQGFSVN